MRFPRRILPVCLAVLPAALLAEDASVGGVVLNDSTGKPVHMALVTLSTTGAKPMEAAVYTDANGAFQFNAVPPGRYYLRAGEFRYQGVGAPTPDHYPGILTLGSGEVRQGIELRMRPLGAISGVVLDQNGDPLPHVNVRLLVSTWARGRRTPAYRNGAASNERGEFRIHGIAPGRYFLSATAQFTQTMEIHPQVTLGEPIPDLVFGRVWYPNATRLQEARPVEVKAGADVQDIVLQMTTTAAASVSGHVEVPDGVAGRGVQMSFVPQDEELAIPATSSFGSNDQKFAMTGLAPGRYTAITMLQDDDQYRGVDEVDLQPGPQEVVLHLQKGVRLTGRLEVQGPGAGNLTQYRITLIPGDITSFRRSRLSAPVDADGAFAFAAVTSGVWDIGVQPIPKGGYVKAMRLGDRDVLTEDMTITPSTSAPLHVVVSTRGGVVTGTAKVPEGTRADPTAADPAMAGLTGSPRAVVLLAPAGKFSHVESFFMMRPADEDGKYEIGGITPGSYKVFAFDHLGRDSTRDPDFMARIDPLGKPVEVHEGERINLDLEVLPAAPVGAEQ
ncbi:MAG: carboxypeptidase-like regulatory domain-containing protein [Bryobacteraceae bacterium]|jgi:protocatechuate 3,4-dioxygenase beta subunit